MCDYYGECVAAATPSPPAATPSPPSNSCSTTDDCPPSQICVSSECTDIVAVGTCDRDIMCGVDMVCAYGQCEFNDCSYDSDCSAADNYCFSGQV